jgi:sorting nexin-29
MWNKEEFPEQWKESIIVPIYEKGDNKMDCSNYRGISLLSTSFKILSNILLSRLTPYVDEIIGNHQCGFRHNRSDILHSSDTGEEMGVQWDYTSAIYRFQENL